jgi:hypothetical protein
MRRVVLANGEVLETHRWLPERRKPTSAAAQRNEPICIERLPEKAPRYRDTSMTPTYRAGN